MITLAMFAIFPALLVSKISFASAHVSTNTSTPDFLSVTETSVIFYEMENFTLRPTYPAFSYEVVDDELLAQYSSPQRN